MLRLKRPGQRTSEKLIQRFCLVLMIFLTLANLSPAQAARGAPGSPVFGMGAILYPRGPFVKEALDMAGDLSLDWISVPISWADYQPASATPPQIDALDTIMQSAARNQIAVLVSISNAPAWARTSLGPDPVHTAQFVLALSQRYPEAIQAVELFPGANTYAGWGSQPDPQAYAALFEQVDEKIHQLDHAVVLVAAGLQPLEASAPTGDMDDLEFLQGLYQQGASQLMQVISVQYHELTGDPLSFPQGGEHRVFRHYEEIRRVMVKNHHANDIVWITHLCLPSGTIGSSDAVYHDLNAQASWMSQAYIQARAQLYIGVMIGQSLNSGAGGAADGVPSLYQGAGEYHPFYSVLHDMISLNKAGGTSIKPGKPKEGYFAKKRP